jgi:FkbM family methyltransferase
MAKLLLSIADTAARYLPMGVKQNIYRLPWLARMVRGSLNRAVPEGLSRVDVAGGGLAGMSLWLDLKSEKDYWLGTYEPDLQAGISALVKPGMVAYDVGANIGYISLLLAKAVGKTGRVYSFEALPQNLKRLDKHITMNDLQDRVEIIPGAVVDRSGPLRFWVGPSANMGKAEGSAGRKPIENGDSIEVEGLSLDDFASRQDHPQPDVVKMDIEGGEVLALPGMRQVLAHAKPLVFLELHGPQAARVAWQEFIEAGYRLCNLSPGYPVVHSLDKLDWKAYLVAFPPPG